MAIAIKNSRKMPDKIGAIRLKNEKAILSAAEDEFSLFGFKGASIRGIAERSGVPKANVLYYFGSKLGVYGALLESILAQWSDSFDKADSHSNPVDVMSNYIRDKVAFSRDNPKASRIFASEIIHGATNLTEYLQQDLVNWVTSRSALMKQWIAGGRMDDLEPAFVLFLVWGATQHYADFEVQVNQVMGGPLSHQDFDKVTETLLHIVIKGCGLK